MDKLKKVFSPGGSKDDKTMYGDLGSESAQQQPGHSDPAPPALPHGENAPQLHNKPDTDKNEHTIRQQILNPSGEKYDELRYGSTASTNPAQVHPSTTEGGENALHTLPEAEKKNYPVGQQILNPGGNKYDEVRYGTTASAYPRDTHPSTTHGGAPGNTVSGTESSPLTKRDTESAVNVKSGVLGPYASHTDDNTAGSGPRNIGSTGGVTGGSSTIGLSDADNQMARDAALTSAGAGGAGAMASGAHRGDEVGNNSYAERSFPLGGGQTSSNTIQASRTSGLAGSGAPTSDSNYAGPATTSGVAGAGSKDTSALASGDGHEGLAGTARTGAGAGILGQAAHDHKGHGHTFAGDPCPPGDEPQVTGYPHHFTGPHSTDTANRLDPHVPGEFPTGSGQDTHKRGGLGSGAALGTGAAGAASLGANEANKYHEPSSRSGVGGIDSTSRSAGGAAYPDPATSGRVSQPSSADPTSGHYLGHDAALAGGAGAAGSGAYAALKHHGESAHTSASGIPDRTKEPTSSVPQSMGTANVRDSNTQSVPSYRQDENHHHGRDTALAGGAGTAGVGAYEATKDRGDTGPVSKTLGPHSSNVANIVDPRVQPEPEKMTDHTTAGPHHSDTLNKVEPSVKENDHHYGRDATVAGGAGAAGLGAYEATRERGDTGPASKTVGPHSSNVANVVDPRVQPQPEKMKDHTTTGPYQSDILNKADPRVESDSAKAQPPEKEHHYGRDAAVAGGVGAAGAGAYAAYDEKHEKELEKKHGKEVKAAERQHEKEMKEHEKEVKKEEKKEHGGLLGKIFHHDKKDKDGEPKKSIEGEHPKGLDYKNVDEARHVQHMREIERIEGAGAIGAGAYEADKHHHNKLHKEPPPEVKQPQQQQMLHPQHMGTDSQIGLGGTANQEGGVVIEPHTHLPMNVGKYGSGHGGTDGSETIEGASHVHGHAGEEGSAGTGWEKTGKANAPY